MAETLRRLSEAGAFRLMQDKVEKWNDNYKLNTTDKNISSCVELIELISRLQGQMFSLLNLCAMEGGEYAGCDALKKRLLPWLSNGFVASSGRLSADTSLSIIAESTEKERQLEILQEDYEKQLDVMESDLNKSKSLADDLSSELDRAHAQLNAERELSVEDSLTKDDQVISLQARIGALQDEVNFYKNQSGVISDYEIERRRLQDEISLLREEKAIMNGTNDFIVTTSPSSKLSSLSTDVFQRVRQASLVSRFGDLFARDRMDGMDVLYNHCDDHELNQKIVFTCVQEAFHAAKSAFNRYRTKVFSALQDTHTGPESLSDAVQKYINKNGQLLDVHSIVEDVLAAMNRHPVISFPAEVNFRILTLFIRETVKVAWSMTALPSPINIAPAREGELFSEKRYRRTRDSEYTAPLVAYYIWPALVNAKGDVLLKGEAVTRRGGALASPRRSRSPSRAVTPSRSRSPSPRRSMMASPMSPAGSRPGSSLSPRPGSAASSLLSLY
ncbi:putative mitochondria-eating protein isoform X3 [Apostichopus japonicus]|uniref:Mitochondria-eating protein n=1 Tax=Stichopus japonicus TaxID=307972 RepID=A0A2G8LG88_STIJA|nr:putative mitochondria-eating protein isoform X3 [Apostichopus japonicus]